MRKLFAIALGSALVLLSATPALAEHDAAPVDAPEMVLGEQAYRGYEQLPVEVKIDLLRALGARDQLIDELDRLQGGDEAVLGESIHRGEVTDEILQEMLAQLRARDELSDTMGTLPGVRSSMPR